LRGGRAARIALDVGAGTELRPATAGDCERLLVLMKLYYAEDGYPFVPDEARAALARFLGDASLGRMWVLVAGGEVVGYAALTLGYSLEYRGRDAFVDELYLLPEHRGGGVGARALACLEDACRALGVRALHLEAERKKPRLLAFYERAGFAAHDRHLMTKTISEG
jgi:GNAT superfamily N-acetyltransferase